MTKPMLENQGGCCGGTQNAQRNDELKVHAGLDASAIARATLPVATNESCCSTGVTGDQITGTNRASEVRGLGEVLTLVTTRDKGGVSAGCGCSPDGNFAVLEEQGQPPLSVDAFDRSPLDLVGRDDVANVDAVLSNDEPGSPECCVDGQCEECGNRDSAKSLDDVACCGGGCCGASENKGKDDGQYSTGTGHERGHVLNGVTEATR